MNVHFLRLDLKKIIYFPIILLVASFFLFSCGDSKKSETEKSETEESGQEIPPAYQYTVNGCSTGMHKFQTFNELCEGLKDFLLNKGCAFYVRKAAYKEYNCNGEFIETNLPNFEDYEVQEKLPPSELPEEELKENTAEKN